MPLTQANKVTDRALAPWLPDWAELSQLQASRQGLPCEVTRPPLRQVGGVGLVCENLQVTGSYKVRAVCHLMQRLRPQAMALASSGNFAVALAWAGRHYGVPVTAVMMRRRHPWKVDRVRALGGRVVLCGDSTEERTATLLELEQDGLTVVDHLTDPQVLVGHATLGLDMAEARPDRVLVPASTGGLLVATALALKQIYPEAEVIGVQPQQADAMVTSWERRERFRRELVTTECDALTANLPGALPWELAQHWVDGMLRVSEVAVKQAVKWLIEEAKLVVEPGGAVGLAALQSGQISRTDRTWVVLSGGNIAPDRLAGWLQAE